MDEIVRDVAEAELPRLLDLYEHLHRKDSPLPDAPLVARAWRDLCSNPAVQVVAIERNGMLVASCTLCIIPNLTRSCRPYGLIENVVTHRAYRRKGLGTAVLRGALSRAWAADCYKVMLLTGSKDPGVHAFYKKVGFVAGEKTGFVARKAVG